MAMRHRHLTGRKDYQESPQRTSHILGGMSTARRLTSREGYAVWATTYDQEQNPLILTEEPRVKAVLASLTPTSRALDVVTGTGRWALYLAERGVSVTGIDESSEMVAVAQQKARAANFPIMFIQGAIEDGLAFPSDCFDLVVCARVGAPDGSGRERSSGALLRVPQAGRVSPGCRTSGPSRKI